MRPAELNGARPFIRTPPALASFLPAILLQPLFVTASEEKLPSRRSLVIFDFSSFGTPGTVRKPVGGGEPRAVAA